MAPGDDDRPSGGTWPRPPGGYNRPTRSNAGPNWADDEFDSGRTIRNRPTSSDRPGPGAGSGPASGRGPSRGWTPAGPASGAAGGSPYSDDAFDGWDEGRENVLTEARGGDRPGGAADHEWQAGPAGPSGPEWQAGGGGGDGGVYETLPSEWSNRRRWSLSIGIVASVVLVALLAGGLYVRNKFDPPGQPGDQVEVQIPRGSSTNQIADILESKGVIPSATAFRSYVKYKGDSAFKAGTYQLHKNSAVWEVLPELLAGPLLPPATGFRVEPGLSVLQIPGAIKDDLPNFDPNKFFDAMASGQVRSKYQTDPSMNYEGFLAPDTYQVPTDANELLVLRLMVDQFDRNADQAGLNRSQELVGHDTYSVLIVASMVEKEAKVDSDRAKIAGVIYNRLDDQMALGIDSTLCYTKSPAPCSLTQSDLATDGPFNTRTRLGLPPTPIAMVSKASLEAALNPTREIDGKPLLYFVLDPQLPAGQHFFTDSEQAFLAAKQRCHDAGLGCD